MTPLTVGNVFNFLSSLTGNNSGFQLRDILVVEQVRSFKYLGSTVNTDNKIEEEIKERIALGNKTFFANKKIFQNKLMSKNAKLKLYFSVIRPVITYACETWILKRNYNQ